MHPARRCTNCNNTATKFLGMIVLDPFIPTELDRMEGYFCNNCFSRRLNAYAMDSITSRLKPPKRSHKCKYCDKEYLDPGILQTHEDLFHSNENEAGTTVIEDPAKRAQEILNEDSKRWATEYVTPPTPGEDYSDKDKVWYVHQKNKGKSEEERHENIRELAKEIGIERLRRANPPWAEFIEKEQKKEQVLKCDECSMVFYSKTALSNHRRAHARRRIGMALQQNKEFYEGVNKKYQEGHYEYVGKKKANGLLKKRGRPKKE